MSEVQQRSMEPIKRKRSRYGFPAVQVPHDSTTGQFVKGPASHGHSINKRHTKTYSAWHSMRDRCELPNNPQYCNYGGRGIRVCERWRKFENFLADMGESPSLKHSIDRFPDNNGNYEPGNCRWATKKEQANNKRTNVFVTFNGETKTVSQWAEGLGWKTNTLIYRLKRGWTIERALRQKIQKRTYVKRRP